MCQITSTRNSQVVEALVLFVATTAFALLAMHLLKNPHLAGIPSFVCAYSLIAAGSALFALGCAKLVRNFFIKS